MHYFGDAEKLTSVFLYLITELEMQICHYYHC